ncbi:MAG: sugar transferase [Myxococcales bacterium]|nr:sugar transferase [Myxococcales bacterium]
MHRLVGPVLALVDALCVSLALFGAWAFWAWRAPNLGVLVQISYADLWLPNRFITAGMALLLVWLAALRNAGLHDPGRMENSAAIASAVTRSAGWVVAVVLAENFLLGERVYPKGLVVPFFALSWMTLLAARLLIFRLLLRLERPPTAVNAVIIGVEADGVAMAERLNRDARHVARLAGHLSTELELNPLVPPERILGTVAEFAELVNRHRIGMVIVAARSLPRGDAMKMAVLADRMGLRVLQAPYSWGVVSPRLGFARIGGLDLIDLVGIRYSTVAARVKRAFDLVAVVIVGLFALPFLLVVAAAIKLQDGGPVLYVSRRTGRGGRTFGFYKFRSMVVGADEQRPHLAAQNEADGRLFKIRDDPRVTRLGRFLRTYSIDELPQLVNVLRGDMNLVGPRPLPAADLDGIAADHEMAYWFDQRSKVNPGITGLWQVSGRSEVGFPEMVRHDIYYIQNWTFWLDLQILAKTVPAVLGGRGAM